MIGGRAVSTGAGVKARNHEVISHEDTKMDHICLDIFPWGVTVWSPAFCVAKRPAGSAALLLW